MIGNIAEAAPWDNEAAIVLVRDIWGQGGEELTISTKDWWLEEETLENEQLVIRARVEDATKTNHDDTLYLGTVALQFRLHKAWIDALAPC